MISSIHPAHQIRTKYRKYQIIALCCTIITVAAALLAALSGLQLTHLRAEREKAIANLPTPVPVEPILQPDPALEKELETAAQRLAEAQRQIATERENVRKLMTRITELERQLAEATNRINQLEKERSATPPPQKTQTPAATSAPAPPKQQPPIAAPASPPEPTIQPPSQIHGVVKPAQTPAPVLPAAVIQPAPEQIPSGPESGQPSTKGAIDPPVSIAPRPQEPEPSSALTHGLPQTPPGSTMMQEPVPDTPHRRPSAEQEVRVMVEPSEIQAAPGHSRTPGLIEETIIPAQGE